MMEDINREKMLTVRRKVVVFILQVPGVLGAIWACFAMVDQFVFHITGHAVKLFSNSFYSFAALVTAFLAGITGLLDYLSREH